MNSVLRTILLALGLLICVGMGMYYPHPWWFRQFFVADASAHAGTGMSPALSQDSSVPTASKQADIRALPTVQPGGFSQDELKAFFEAAAKAEAIADPLQRCLNYPDPPGSNWSHVAVEAYCRYRTMSVPSRAELLSLIHAGHAAKLDRLLSNAVLRERADPNSRGLVDHIILGDFRSGSAEMRDAIESWKRQRPRSAFAFAASGLAYMHTAANARGGKYADQTPDAAFEKMHKLLDYAEEDLATALRLDPTLASAYAALVSTRKFDGDPQRLQTAIAAALRAVPADYDVYAEIMEAVKPRWCGSYEAMHQVALDAGAKSELNPLLLMLQVEPDAEAANLSCGCGEPTNPADYRKVFDRIAMYNTMDSAAISAADIERYDLAVVYRSETVRWGADSILDHSSRLAELVHFENLPSLRNAARQLARSDAAFLIQTTDDLDMLSDAGQWLAEMSLWDPAWTYSEKLIQTHPDEPDGWILRARIQKEQPRTGLKETATYLVQHFSDNPKAKDAVELAKWELLLLSGQK